MDIDLYHFRDECINLRYDASTQTLTLDRSALKNTYATERGETRTLRLDEPLKNLHVFRDTSTLEIFINQGRYTLSLRFFPQHIEGHVKIKTLNDTRH
ncbi:GH32 C-terminal domain-containing protein [Erysipelothrix sp. D19-032]